MLDSGPQSFKLPEHIFITHSHIDHCASLPFTLITDDHLNKNKVNVYAHTDCEQYLYNYVKSMFELNSLVTSNKEEEYYIFNPQK